MCQVGTSNFISKTGLYPYSSSTGVIPVRFLTIARLDYRREIKYLGQSFLDPSISFYNARIKGL
jgi:hypothetical protein